MTDATPNPDIQADAKFFLTARRAWEIMKRRGWGAAQPWGKIGPWCAVECKGDDLLPRTPIKASDPFAAIIAADDWYVANIEKAGAK